MSKNLLSRLMAILVLSGGANAYVSHYNMKWHNLGREAFLAYQSARFDRFMAHPRPHFIGEILIIACLIGLYEAIVRIFRSMLGHEAQSSSPR
jgi:hypothetical protein